MPNLSLGRLRLAALACTCLTLGACGGGSGSTPGGDSPPDAPPAGPPAPTPTTVAFSSAAETVLQAAGSATITVNRAGGTDAVSVVYATTDGTAIAGSNYTATSGTLTWSAGDTSAKSVTVPIAAAAFSDSKAFMVMLSSAQGATLGTPSTATVTINGSATAGGGTSAGPAAALAAKLGAPSRLLIGVGSQVHGDPISTVKAQGVKIDIYERYLGGGDWTSWNSAPCDYVCVVSTAADSVGAIPMFTQYQMANNGDGNISVIADSAFMATYWSRAKQLFQDLGAYNKPALVNLEPDFWGYVERTANADPTQVAAVVNSNPDCAAQPNNVSGLARCLIAMARKYAPKAYVGFPFSDWGGDSDAQVVAFMNALGAQHADFIVEQTLDRDAGCFEAAASNCQRSAAGLYWDESNLTHPSFHDHLSSAQAYHSGVGNLPIIWWQTPEGVPSSVPGGTAYHYRDNREHYFLTHPAELTAVGGLGVVFSAGADFQTDITTDGGQFQSLSSQYLASPAALP